MCTCCAGIHFTGAHGQLLADGRHDVRLPECTANLQGSFRDLLETGLACRCRADSHALQGMSLRSFTSSITVFQMVCQKCSVSVCTGSVSIPGMTHLCISTPQATCAPKANGQVLLKAWIACGSQSWHTFSAVSLASRAPCHANICIAQCDLQSHSALIMQPCCNGLQSCLLNSIQPCKHLIVLAHPSFSPSTPPSLCQLHKPPQPYTNTVPLAFLQAFERRLWPHSHALRQFERALSPEILLKLEERGFTLERLWDMSGSDIGAALRHPNAGDLIVLFHSTSDLLIFWPLNVWLIYCLSSGMICMRHSWSLTLVVLKQKLSTQDARVLTLHAG